MSEFTEADKVTVLSTINSIIQEDKDKYHAYHDIYHVLKGSCDCKVPDDKILPEREALLRFLQKKMADHECHGLVHERLVKVVENLPTADAIPPAGSHFYRFFNDSVDYNEFLHGNNHVLGAELLETVKDSIGKKRSREDKGDKEDRFHTSNKSTRMD